MTQSLLTVDVDGLIAALGLDIAINQEAARPAAQAGAQVLYEAVRVNVASLKRWTGNLQRSIYQAYSQDNSRPGYATYHISWNAKKAPHGHLVEWGFLQRYKTYQTSYGWVLPMVRPGMEGRPRPGRRASQAEKDAYYVPLEGGPRHVAAKAFVRGALAKREAALQAMAQTYLQHLQAAGVVS